MPRRAAKVNPYSSRTNTLFDVVKTLEAAGIEFIGSPDDGPGIRLRAKP